MNMLPPDHDCPYVEGAALVAEGQRRINMIWETTQAVIALAITFAVIFCAVTQTDSAILVNAFFLIVGFYFSRTNHSAIGGVGAQPQQPYIGR